MRREKRKPRGPKVNNTLWTFQTSRHISMVEPQVRRYCQPRAKGITGGEVGEGSHCQVVVRASSGNPGSESLKRMMSLGDPKTRLHSTICRSRGS